MPKLHSDFHKPRVEAYTMASNNLKTAAEDPDISHAQRTERLYVAKTLDRECRYFKHKHSIK